MKAAVLRSTNAPLSVEDVQIDKPGPREVLIHVAACGVCHSDLSVQQGLVPYPLPTVLGHEAAGVVEAVGSEVRQVKQGDHVITCVSAFCGHCSFCLSGHLSLCGSLETRRAKGEPERLSIGGKNIRQFFNLSAFAELMLVHEHACVRISPDIAFDKAALVGCAVLTGFGAVTRAAAVRPGEVVAVIGCGGIGLAAINAARISGAGRIIAIDRVPQKLDLARRFGATDALLAGGEVEAAVLEMTKGGVDHCIEAVGLKLTAELAFRLVRRGGTATIVGVFPEDTKIEIDAAGFFQEKRIQGTLMGSNQFPTDVPRLIDLYLQGRLELDLLLAKRIRLDEVNTAFEDLKTGATARSVIVF